MTRLRKPIRRTWHKPFAPANRPGFRQRWRAPDDLALGLTAFRRAIRAHRRLARLAPHHFDFAVVDRDQLEHQERLRWKSVWAPAIEKAYGPPTTAEREAELHADWLASQPPHLPPDTERAVDRHLADWKFWMEAGRQAWDRHRQRRPHALIGLSRLARMLEIAVDLGRLATGLDSDQPVFVPHNDDAVWADLQRAYGHLDHDPGSSRREEAQTPPQNSSASAAVASPPPASSATTQPPVTLAPSSLPPPDSSPPPLRCDTYRRLARQLRRLHK